MNEHHLSQVEARLSVPLIVPLLLASFNGTYKVNDELSVNNKSDTESIGRKHNHSECGITCGPASTENHHQEDNENQEELAQELNGIVLPSLKWSRCNYEDCVGNLEEEAREKGQIPANSSEGYKEEAIQESLPDEKGVVHSLPPSVDLEAIVQSEELPFSQHFFLVMILQVVQGEENHSQNHNANPDKGEYETWYIPDPIVKLVVNVCH